MKIRCKPQKKRLLWNHAKCNMKYDGLLLIILQNAFLFTLYITKSAYTSKFVVTLTEIQTITYTWISSSLLLKHSNIWHVIKLVIKFTKINSVIWGTRKICAYHALDEFKIFPLNFTLNHFKLHIKHVLPFWLNQKTIF